MPRKATVSPSPKSISKSWPISPFNGTPAKITLRRQVATSRASSPPRASRQRPVDFPIEEGGLARSKSSRTSKKRSPTQPFPGHGLDRVHGVGGAGTGHVRFAAKIVVAGGDEKVVDVNGIGGHGAIIPSLTVPGTLARSEADLVAAGAGSSCVPGTFVVNTHVPGTHADRFGVDQSVPALCRRAGDDSFPPPFAPPPACCIVYPSCNKPPSTGPIPPHGRTPVPQKTTLHIQQDDPQNGVYPIVLNN